MKKKKNHNTEIENQKSKEVVEWLEETRPINSSTLIYANGPIPKGMFLDTHGIWNKSNTIQKNPEDNV